MSSENKNKIAVIGIGCTFPGAKTKEEFWEVILSRRQQFRKHLDARLPMKDYFDPDKKVEDMCYGKYASYVEGFEFEWAKRLIPKITYESNDIVHWLSLDTAIRTLEDAGYDPKILSNSNTGVIVGNSLTGEQTRASSMRLRWPYVLRSLKKSGELAGISDEQIQKLSEVMQKVYKSVFPATNEDTLAGALSNTIAGRICNYLNLKGGGYTVDGACSSSLIAVATAADALQSGKIDLAIAGGVDVSLDTFELIGFAKTGALSTNTMHVYDKKAQGFIPGEGAGFVLLKRLDDAIRDKDKIYAVVNGWGISSDGKGGITAPDKQGQSNALQRAYRMAGYSPAELSFIEGHGTGTVVGDRTEIEGIALTMQAFGVESTERTVSMTSLKSIMGHMKAAAGIGAFIKAVMAVNRRIVPPTAGCIEPNPIFNSVAKNLYPAIRGEIKSDQKIMKAGISAMGFGGINCHVTIQSGTLIPHNIITKLSESKLLCSSEDHEAFPISSSSVDGLINKIQQLILEVEKMSFAEMVDLAASLSDQIQENDLFRVSVVAPDPGELLKKLKEAILLIESNSKFIKNKVASNADRTIIFGEKKANVKIGFMFPGQASQFLNMAKNLIERYDWAQEKFKIASDILKSKYKIDLGEIIFKDYFKAENADQVALWEKNLAQTNLAQPAICVATALWIEHLKRLNIHADFVLGHSLGELCSFYYANAIDFQELVEISALRGSLMASSSEAAGSMASLACDKVLAEKIIKEVEGYLTIANINSPKQTVISGHKEAISLALKVASKYQVVGVPLKVSNAFHSQLVEPASIEIKNFFSDKRSSRSLVKNVITCVDGKISTTNIDLKEYLSLQIVRQVDFVSSIHQLVKQTNIIIEVGPGDILSKISQQNFEGQAMDHIFSLSKKNLSSLDYKIMLSGLFVQGVSVRWAEVYQDRMVKKFIPFLAKTFIENSIERDFHVPEYGLIRSSDIKSEYRPFVFNDEVPGKMDSAKNTPSLEEGTVLKMNSFKAQSVGSKKVRDSVVGLICERTGFVPEMLRMDMKLIEDLNLDSIKAAEIVATLVAEFDVHTEIDMAKLSVGTLDDLIVALSGSPSSLSVPITQAYAAASGSDVVISSNSYRSQSIKPPALVVVAKSEPGLGAEKVKGAVVGLICERTGFVPEMIRLDMKLIEDLNLDSIKAAEIVATLVAEFDVTSEIDMAKLSVGTLEDLIFALSGSTIVVSNPSAVVHQLNAIQSPIINIAVASPRVNQNKVQSSVVNLICERTGFVPEMIRLDMKLIEDLNLDSIKAAEIVATLVAEFDISTEIDMSKLSTGTLQDLIYALCENKNGDGSPESEVKTIAKQQEPIVVPQTPKVLETPVGAAQIIIRAVAKLTDFPPLQITEQLRLQSDLGISKSGVEKLIQAVCSEMAIAPNLDIDVLQDYSIGELTRVLKILEKNKNQKLEVKKKNNLKNYDRWIRSFNVKFKRQDRPSGHHETQRNSDNLNQARVLILIDDSMSPLAFNLSQSLAQAGAYVDLKQFSDILKPKEKEPMSFTHIFYFQPITDSDIFGVKLLRAVDRVEALRRVILSNSAVVRSKNLSFVQFCSGTFDAGFPTMITEVGSVHAIASALDKERSDYKIRTFNVGLNLDHRSLSKEILEDIKTPNKFEVVGYDSDLNRFVFQLEAQFKKQQKPKKIQWSSNDVIVVSGGAKGITAECAIAFAKKHNVKLALLGSSALSADDENLKRFQGEKVDFKYYQCDVADEKNVKNTISLIQQQGYNISGVIHGAGKNIPRLFVSVIGQNALNEISPKILGIHNLLNHLDLAKLKMVAALTSILGVDNVPGNAWYGYSNEVCHNILRKFSNSQPACHTICIAYGMWAEVGMAAQLKTEDRFSDTGVRPIPKNEGIKSFLNLTETSTGFDEVILTSGIWEGSQISAPPAGKPIAKRYLDQTVMALDKVEVLCQAKLTLQDDKYVADHCFNGNYLFPTVFGMEAMAQAAAFVTGIHEPDSVQFEHVKLELPITVDPKSGTEIEVHAYILDDEPTDFIRIKCAVRTEVTQFKKDHFSAIITFNKKWEA